MLFQPDSIRKFNLNPKIHFKMMENAAYVLDFCKRNNFPTNFTAENICNKDNLILILKFVLSVADKLGWAADKSMDEAAVISPRKSATLEDSILTGEALVSPKLNYANGNDAFALVLSDLITSEKDYLQDLDILVKVGELVLHSI